MSDEELEVLITLDDPWYGPDEDAFHLQRDSGWPSLMEGEYRGVALGATA